jgi:hypothetical protein
MNVPAPFLVPGSPGDAALEGAVAILNRLLAACRPERVLLAVGEGQAGPVPAGEAPCRIDVRESTAPLPADRYGVAVLFRVEAGGRREEATHLLAALRDVYAGEVIVVPGPEGEGWEREELLGLGLRRVSRPEEPAVYAFRLSDYKVTPEWLNSRFWAHPELFGKYRW